MDELTLQQRATNYETWQHIHRVQQLLLGIAKQLLDRALQHDQSKLRLPEVAGFSRMAPLAGVTYGSPEYQQMVKEQLGEALAHHYAHNRHHPEHYPDGINDMTLVDLLEMFCDWKAASERHRDGDIRQSIAVNTSRFGIQEQLRRILENTVAVF